MRKIRYIEFRNEAKYNLTTLKNGDFRKNKPKNKKLNNFKFLDDESLKISLTTKDKCECDKLIIDYFAKERIENMVFHFEYFYPLDKNKYSIKIYCTKDKLKFLDRLKRKKERKKYWKIEVDKINKNGEFLCRCMETYPGTNEGIELEKILQNSEKNIQEKLIDFLRKHKYNNIYLDYENLTLLERR